jgi:biopolymer transport protein TolQ
MRMFRLIAVAFAVLTLSFAAPALAQHAPSAAPAGSGVSESHDLDAPGAAPTTNGDVTPAGTDIESGATRLSVISVFLRADPVVKAVMVILLIASLWSWTIIINKWLAFGTLKRRATKFEKVFWSGQSLDELYQQFAAKTDHPMAATFVAALREWRRAFEGGAAPRESALAGIKERIEKAMGVTILRETDGLENQLGFLATVGSTAPFVGLFGTVWGIMNSFTAIAAQHNTTLAVVAPGIAEALFATAMGLLAAIPAVIFYNRFVNEIARYTTRLDAFADEFSAILSRQLDEKAH